MMCALVATCCAELLGFGFGVRPVNDVAPALGTAVGHVGLVNGVKTAGVQAVVTRERVSRCGDEEWRESPPLPGHTAPPHTRTLPSLPPPPPTFTHALKTPIAHQEYSNRSSKYVALFDTCMT